VNAATNCAAPPCGPGNWPTALVPTAVGGPPFIVQGVTLPNDAWGRSLLYTSASAGTNICGQPAGTVLTFIVVSIGIDGQFSTNGGTGLNDDLTLTITVDQIRSQLQTRFGAC